MCLLDDPGNLTPHTRSDSNPFCTSPSITLAVESLSGGIDSTTLRIWSAILVFLRTTTPHLCIAKSAEVWRFSYSFCCILFAFW